jgi:hypothetical protein
MFKVSHQTLIIISGAIWFAVGVFLLTLGLGFLVEGMRSQAPSSTPFITLLAPYFGGLEQAVVIIIALALYIGYLKGRYVLGKSAKRGIDRIHTLENPSSLAKIYSAKYYILLAVMIGLGISMKFFGLSTDIRGAIDVVVGSALINGGMLYFRSIKQHATQ